MSFDRRLPALGAVLLFAVGTFSACSTPSTARPADSVTHSTTGSSASSPAGSSPAATGGSPPAATGGSASPGELPYAHTRSTDVQGNARNARRLVYVPNQLSGSVQVIDPDTYAVVGRFPVGRSPEHVVPSPDLGVLWVNSDAGNSMTPIDPVSGKPLSALKVDDPYNLYFTPSGTEALVMASRLRRVDVRDAKTMQLKRSVPVPCRGINHGDYTADLTTFLASCEFSGKLVVFDKALTTVTKVIDLNAISTPGSTSADMARSMGGPRAGLETGASAMPQDVRLSPDGRSLLVADMLRNGIWVINAQTMEYDRFVPTGLGTHGIYPSRDASRVYVTNRDEGTVSVLDAATLKPAARWQVPGGGSPDMGGVTADGKELWLSGRYHAVVYVFDTATGQLTHRIPVDSGPHGLLVWPQPGRFSIGHTGNMR